MRARCATASPERWRLKALGLTRGRLDFIYVEGRTADQLFAGARRVGLFPGVETLVPGVDHKEIRGYFERHGLLERYHEIERALSAARP